MRAMSEAAVVPDTTGEAVKGGPVEKRNYERVSFVVYGLAVVAALSVWFLAIRAPLWLDETGSYWNIAGGFRQIWARSIELNSFPAYYYILWLTNLLFGSKEIVFRVPSVLAMGATTYVVYRCGRELFSREVALIAAVLFILDRRIVFEAIDVRPYSFALLMTSLAIFSFIRWSKTNRSLYAAVFGTACAWIFYFHYLFGCIVAAFAICYLIDRGRAALVEWRQVGIAAGCFALLIIPVCARLWYLHQTRNTHVFAEAPAFRSFLRALAAGVVPFVFLGIGVIAAATRKLSKPTGESLRQFFVCGTLAFVPVAILYGITLATPLHVFVERYEAVAVPGIALSWAWLLTLVDSRPLRLLCCAALVTWGAYGYYTSPRAGLHGFTWKYALEFADANAARDGAPLLICSDLPEADFQSMPAGPASESVLFSPLSYYKIRARVVPMPRALNEQAELIGRNVSSQAALRHERFLAIGFKPSYPTLRWLEELTAASHTARVVGSFDGIQVVEFDPQNIRAK
jgi:Dolichyl-phosphate-mannose-protein mannosyltransferase